MQKFLILAAAAAAFSAPASATQLLINGDFETGDFTGWTAIAFSGSSGSLNISTPGTNTPISGFATAGNANGGRFYAVTDQGGPGAYSLAQSFVVPTGTSSLILDFDFFANNQAGVTIVSPNGLDPFIDANQHSRVDLLVAGASAFSTTPGDILGTFYLGSDSFSTPNPFTHYSIDISSLVTAGQTYQIRFAEADNQFFFQTGIDNVLVHARTVPEPASWAMMIAGFGLVGGAMRRRARTTVTA